MVILNVCWFTLTGDENRESAVEIINKNVSLGAGEITQKKKSMLGKCRTGVSSPKVLI